jgi:hypothetical protein
MQTTDTDLNENSKMMFICQAALEKTDKNRYKAGIEYSTKTNQN